MYHVILCSLIRLVWEHKFSFYSLFKLSFIICATKQGLLLSLWRQTLYKLSSLDLERAAPLFRWPSAHLHSYCPWSNDYLAVLREKRNKTERKNSFRLVAVTQCSISFQTARLISSLSLLCLWPSLLCDSSLRLQGNSRTGMWKQAGYFSCREAWLQNNLFNYNMEALQPWQYGNLWGENIITFCQIIKFTVTTFYLV